MKERIARARELRRQGRLLREIAAAIGVSLHTASLYCKGVMPPWKNGDDPRKAEVLPLLRALYAAGRPVSAIAELTGVPAPTLYDWRRELGLPKNSRAAYVDDALRQRVSEQFSKDLTGELQVRAVQLYVEDGMSTPEIGALLGVTAPTVGQWLTNAGVEKRLRPSIRTRTKLREANLGPKRYNWKGGITPYRVRTRTSLLMKVAREICFQRDGFRCRICGERGGKLNAHHIWPFQRFRDRIFDPTNLITLCKACHDAFHKAAGGHVRIAIGPFFGQEIESSAWSGGGK